MEQNSAKKLLFIDRDGTLILEPPDEQVDSFDKLTFYPGALTYLSKIAALGYELVMVSNQDGLGTASFPEANFWPVHNFMVKTFDNEGVVFTNIVIDRTLPSEGAPTRKPGTALLTQYFSDAYDLANSFVIGDRKNDIVLAKNLGAKALWLRNNDALGQGEGLEDIDALKTTIALETKSWKDIYAYLKLSTRTAVRHRKTKETDILVEIGLDGQAEALIDTGLSFFDHMLEQISRHGGISLKIIAKGDLQVDEHHTIEDTGIALGEAFALALGDKTGIERYGFCLPMDDCLAQAAIDLGGRGWLVWAAEFKRERIGDMPTEMFFHFFKSFSDGAKCNLNIKAEGINEHHKIEAIFKVFAKALKMAIRRDPEKMILPSTKGVVNEF